jgi:hypothetical protein
MMPMTPEPSSFARLVAYTTIGEKDESLTTAVV